MLWSALVLSLNTVFQGDNQSYRFIIIAVNDRLEMNSLNQSSPSHISLCQIFPIRPINVFLVRIDSKKIQF